MKTPVTNFRIGEQVRVSRQSRVRYGAVGFITRIEEHAGVRRYLVSFNSGGMMRGSDYYQGDEIKRHAPRKPAKKENQRSQ